MAGGSGRFNRVTCGDRAVLADRNVRSGHNSLRVREREVQLEADDERTMDCIPRNGNVHR